MNDRLILAFGMPRSGTTWVGKILDSHPYTLYRHEPDSWRRLKNLRLIQEEQPNLDFTALRNYASELPLISAPRVCAKPPIFKKAYLGAFRYNSLKASANAARFLAVVWKNVPVIGGSGRKLGHKYTIWKSIESLGRLGVISKALNRPPSIQIIRHPCGHVASVMRGEKNSRFDSDTAASEDYGVFEMLCATTTGKKHGLDIASLKAMTPIERVAWRWVIVNEKALDEMKNVESHYVLNYDELCENPVAVTKDLFQHCQLEWNEQTAAFLQASSQQKTDSYYGVFKDPKVSAKKWKKELTDKEIELIIEVAKRSEPLAQLFDL